MSPTRQPAAEPAAMTLSQALISLALTIWREPTGEARLQGYSTYYAPGLMQKVARNRGISLEGYAGGVALNRAGDLRRIVWLEWPGGDVTGPYLSVDCAQRIHFHMREAQNRIVEVDAETAKTRGFYGVGPHPVTVHFQRPELHDED